LRVGATVWPSYGGGSKETYPSDPYRVEIRLETASISRADVQR